MNKKLNEDLMTPVFKGDDLSVNAALQAWTSLMQVFSSVESMVQDNTNRLAIFDGFKQLIDQKTYVITQPAQASMASATAAVTPAPAVTAPALTPATLPEPAVASDASCPCEVEDEEEEKEIESDEEGKDPVNPASQADAPEVTVVGDSDDKKDDEETDKDKKAVVDLTIEDRLTKLEKKNQMSESTRRALELAGIRVKL